MKNFPFFKCFFCLGIGTRKFINNSILICLDPIIFKKVIKRKRTKSQKKKLLFMGHLGVCRVINIYQYIFLGVFLKLYKLLFNSIEVS